MWEVIPWTAFNRSWLNTWRKWLADDELSCVCQIRWSRAQIPAALGFRWISCTSLNHSACTDSPVELRSCRHRGILWRQDFLIFADFRHFGNIRALRSEGLDSARLSALQRHLLRPALGFRHYSFCCYSWRWTDGWRFGFQLFMLLWDWRRKYSIIKIQQL